MQDIQNVGQKEVLKDLNQKGKVIDWRGHKKQSLVLSDSYLRLGYLSKAHRLKDCGSLLEFKKFSDNTMRLHKAEFCKVRLCPMCAWRRSLKVFGQVSRVMDYIERHYDYKYIFATFTAKNVPGDMLSDEIDKYFKAFNAMTKRKEFKTISRGWFRCLEVTHNWERDDYHTHFHMVIAVNKRYFKDDKAYMTHDDWMRLWRSCLGIDYDPWVYIRKVKPGEEDGKNYKKVVAEVAKYAVKAGDYILSPDENCPKDFREMIEEDCNRLTDEAVAIVDTALHNRRLIAFGGEFKKVHKLMRMDDAEDGDLINTNNEDDELREDLNYIFIRYGWMPGFGNYIRVEE